MILNSINSEESYVKYHIHTVSMEDNLENICTKYGVSLNTLKKYNTFDSLELNMKLLIPENEES
jgi:LysM repeat protein